MKRVVFVCALVVLAGGVAMAAQESSEPHMKMGSDRRTELNPSLADLQYLEGKWHVEHMLDPNLAREENRKNMKSEGTFFVHRDLNGNALMGRFHEDAASSGGQSPFEGRLIIAAPKQGQRAPEAKAPGDKNISMVWVDSMGNTSLATDVKLDNKQLVANFMPQCQAEDAREKLGKGRVTFERMGDDKVRYVMEADMGKGWQPVATAVYTRMADERSGEREQLH